MEMTFSHNLSLLKLAHSAKSKLYAHVHNVPAVERATQSQLFLLHSLYHIGASA